MGKVLGLQVVKDTKHLSVRSRREAAGHIIYLVLLILLTLLSVMIMTGNWFCNTDALTLLIQPSFLYPILNLNFIEQILNWPQQQ